MIKYIAKRLLMLIPILIAVTFVIFSLLYITPGDPAKMILGQTASQEAVAELRTELGLDQPFLVQYLNYMKKMIFHLDIGTSYTTKQPVLDEIMNCLPHTLKLALSSIFLAVLIGVPIGVISAVKQYSIFDNIVMVLGLAGISMPVFWLGLLLIIFFCVRLGILPASGYSSWQQMILPAVTLSAQSIAVVARMTRSSMLEEIRKDYVRTVRMKGQTEMKITILHGLRNALIPIVTVIGTQFGSLLGGAVMCETIFSIPGIGRLMVDSIKTRNFPVVQGGVLFIAIGFALVNLFVDIIYAFLDPKIKAQYK